MPTVKIARTVAGGTDALTGLDSANSVHQEFVWTDVVTLAARKVDIHELRLLADAGFP